MKYQGNLEIKCTTANSQNAMLFSNAEITLEASTFNALVNKAKKYCYNNDYNIMNCNANLTIYCNEKYTNTINIL